MPTTPNSTPICKYQFSVTNGQWHAGSTGCTCTPPANTHKFGLSAAQVVSAPAPRNTHASLTLLLAGPAAPRPNPRGFSRMTCMAWRGLSIWSREELRRINKFGARTTTRSRHMAVSPETRKICRTASLAENCINTAVSAMTAAATHALRENVRRSAVPIRNK